MKDYTAKPDAEGRLPLRGDALAARYRVRHRADGVIELQPESDPPISDRTLQTLGRSVGALGRGGASAPVDLDETFPDFDADEGLGPNARAAAVAELAAEIERLRIEAGYTTDELLESLRGERERATRERYGDAFVDGLAAPRSEA
ncbi:hypothetical protein [Rubrivirga sp.]|uniref:hypothetical protein n=1 Tax=Rubrivirga sp. TaxID=1885344 RepID=UPI003C78A26F